MQVKNEIHKFHAVLSLASLGNNNSFRDKQTEQCDNWFNFKQEKNADMLNIYYKA